MSIQTTLAVTILPFGIPEYLDVKTGSGDHVQVPLTDFSPEDLDRFCSDFKNRVFKLAGKSQPPVAEPVPYRQPEPPRAPALLISPAPWEV